MFILLDIEDKILLDPADLNPTSSVTSNELKPFPLPSINNINEIQQQQPQTNKQQDTPLYTDIVYNKLRNKYINKIILNQGLVVSIYKYTIKSNMIVEIEGVINVEYECSLIVFRPQIGDVLYGKITHSNQDNIIVDCDIIKVKIPNEQLMKPANYDNEEKVWFWSYENNNYYYDIGEKCRMKVIDVNFISNNHLMKLLNEHSEDIEGGDKKIKEFQQNENEEDVITKDKIMEITCTFNEEGLGPIKWWK